MKLKRDLHQENASEMGCKGTAFCLLHWVKRNFRSPDINRPAISSAGSPWCCEHCYKHPWCWDSKRSWTPVSLVKNRSCSALETVAGGDARKQPALWISREMLPGTLTLLLAPWFPPNSQGTLTYLWKPFPLLKRQPGPKRNRNWTSNHTPEVGGEWHCCCILCLHQRPPGSRTDEYLETKNKFPRTESFASQWEGRCSRARMAVSLRLMQHLAPADSATVIKGSVKHWHLPALCKKYRFWGKVSCLRFKVTMMKKWDLHIGRWWSLNGHRSCLQKTLSITENRASKASLGGAQILTCTSCTTPHPQSHRDDTHKSKVSAEDRYFSLSNYFWTV